MVIQRPTILPMSGKRETITVAAGQLTARLMNEAAETLTSIDNAIRRAAQMRVELLVLPECAYPAYLLGSVTSYRAGGHLKGDAYVEWLCDRARRHRLHIVSGLVEDAGTGLYNSAVLISDAGRELGRSRKRFLWHADHDWFEPGEEVRAIDSSLGRIGIVICAETRAPEILATLVADGAEMIALPTCWINQAREPGQYYNPQTDYLIEARAREFGLPFICADKAGVELAAVGYVGQSRIVRADGSVAAEAPPTGDAVIAARVMRRPARKTWTSDGRRKRLLAPQPGRPATDRTPRRVTVAAMPTVVANASFAGGMGEALFRPLQERGVQLLLVNMTHETPAEQLALLARAFDLHAIGFPAEADAFGLGPARVGCVAGQWIRSFPASRDLALAGAEILLLFDAPRDLPILRTRAMENRVFIMGVSDRWAVIIGPDGKLLAEADEHQPATLVVEIDLAEALDKSVAPKTDIFAERRPGLYRL